MPTLRGAFVVGSVADLGGLGTLNSGVGKHKPKGGVIDTREVARARWLVLLRAKGEGVHVNASVWVASVVLVWLHKVEVGTLTLREGSWPLLKLSSHDWVSPSSACQERFQQERRIQHRKHQT